jgi:hypothetical protein
LVTYFNTWNKSSNEVKVMHNLGNQHVSKFNDTVSLAITKTSELIEVIIPFFEKYRRFAPKD